MNAFKRILLVEDDPQDIELTINALGEYNLANEIEITRDGAEALDYIYRKGVFASRPSGNPIVILLDLKLPKVSGIQVVNQLKSDERLRYVPIVILTSSRESSDLKECYKLGVNAYVLSRCVLQNLLKRSKELVYSGH